MGSPVSAILANLVMEHVEERALDTTPHSPKWWYRYVDDSNVCLSREHLTEFHNHLNSINPHIKFTVEEKKMDLLHFSTRGQPGIPMEQLRLACTGKPHILTSTFTSTLTTLHNTNARLLEPFSTGATKIPSTADNKLSEVQHVVDELKINGYTDSFIRSCQNTTTPTPEVQPQSQTRKGFVTLPYSKGISEKNCKYFESFQRKCRPQTRKDCRLNPKKA